MCVRFFRVGVLGYLFHYRFLLCLREKTIRIKNLKDKQNMKSFNFTRFSLIIAMCAVVGNTVSAQTSKEPKTEYIYSLKTTPLGMDNYFISTYYYHGKNTFNLRNIPISTTSGEIISMKINPSGTSFALLTRKGENTSVSIHDLWKAKKVLHEFKKIGQASGICYTPDAKQLLVSTDNGLKMFDARSFVETGNIEMPFTANILTVSNNGYYLAATDGIRLVVWNMESKEVRKVFDLGVKINSIAFSDDSNIFAVLTEDGGLATYDTQQFFILQNYDAMGQALHCAFHPEGKYISVVCGDKRIAVVNLLDGENRNYIDNAAGGTTDVRFVKDGKKQIFLAYNTTASIIYKLMSELTPYYTKLLADELEEKMNDWMKQMPNESLEEYKLRVNEETRAKQMRLFEQEIATRMADNMVQMATVSFGNYNPESNMLAVNFDNMPSIYLDVPANEVGDFMDPGNLEFRNAKYGLTKEDKFELVYADVYNKSTGKTYTFDNQERRSLDFLKTDDKFVPLEVIQQSNMEEMRLMEIKENVVQTAKQANAISDHTNISVNSNVVSTTDANGQKIMNYVVNFSYQVEQGYSAQEDFGPGKYKAEDSGAAMSMLAIIKQAFEGEFAPYVKSGKKLQIKITGMADALPINGKIAYDGCYGDYTDEPVYKDNELSSLTVTKASGVTQNEQLAFLRALGVNNYISQNINGFSAMNTDYKYYIEVTKGKGGEFRRINVELTFIDAF